MGPPDVANLVHSLDHHSTRFGQPPAVLAADRGFSTVQNERLAEAHGICCVALPHRARLASIAVRLNIAQPSALHADSGLGSRAASVCSSAASASAAVAITAWPTWSAGSAGRSWRTTSTKSAAPALAAEQGSAPLLRPERELEVHRSAECA